MSAAAWLALLAGLVTLGAVAAGRRRQRHRRRLLREAMHELRRPLQALALEGDSRAGRPLHAQLRTALADLEQAIDGRRGSRQRDPVALRELLDDAAGRWAGSPRPVVVERGGRGRGAVLEADRVRLGMALDNLIANGLEHGRGPVSVAASVGERTLRLEVRNGRRRGTRSPDGTVPPPKGIGDPRRGHGLRIAGREVACEDGELLPPRAAADGAIVTAVELPRADGGASR